MAQNRLEIPKTGFEIINFDELERYFRIYLPQILEVKHSGKPSGWQPEIDRVQMIRKILAEPEKFDAVLKLLPKQSQLEPYTPYTRDYILTIAAWELTDYIYHNSTRSAFNSSAFTAVCAALHMYDPSSHGHKLIKENLPSMEMQKKMLTDYLHIFNHLVYVDGVETKHFLPETLLNFDKKSSKEFLDRLDARLKTCTQDLRTTGLKDEQSRDKRDIITAKQQQQKETENQQHKETEGFSGAFFYPRPAFNDVPLPPTTPEPESKYDSPSPFG